MNASITALDLFEWQQERWRDGSQARAAARPNRRDKPPASLAGYLNIIYPNKVQIPLH